MRRDYPQHLGSEVAQIKRAIQDLQSGRLQNASMHGTRLYIYDDDGDIREIIGNQGDGSYGSRVVKSPPQPTTTAPVLTPVLTGGKQLGSVEASWDGGIVQGDLPVVHGYVQVWSQRVGEDDTPDPEQAHLVSSIRDRDGGATTIICPTPGVWAVWFRMVGADRVTMGEFSEHSLVEVESLVDAEQIRDDLQEAREQWEAANEAAQEALDQLRDDLTELNDVRLVELEEALSASEQRVEDARIRLDAAEQNVQDTEAELADLRDNRLPGLEDSLNNGLANLWTENADLRTTVAQNAQTAQQRADEAKEMAERALATAGDNVIEDPSFENANYWPSRWNGVQGYGVVSATDSEAPHGARVLRVDSANRTGNAAVWFTSTGFGGAPALMNVTPGDVIRFAIRYRGNFNNHFRLRFMDRSGDRPVLIDEQFTRPTNANDWQRAVVDFTIPAGVSVVSVGLGFFFTSGVLVLDQAEMRDITRAYEALQVAQQAIQAAEAAHAEAGSAYALAEQALQSTGAQPTILHGTTPPTGSSVPVGTIWFQWSSLNDDREVEGTWVRTEDGWDTYHLARQLIPQIDIGEGTFGHLRGDRLEAFAATFRHVAIGNWTNLFVDPDFSEYAQYGADGALWSVRSGSGAWTTITVSSGERALTIHPNTVTAGGRLAHTPNGSGVRARPGDQFTVKLRAFVSANVGTSNCRLRVFFRNAQGVHVANSTVITFNQAGTNDYENSFTVPANADIRLMDFDFEYTNSDPKNTTIWNPNCRQRVDGSLIVDGSVGARQILAEEIAAAVASFLRLHADQITAGTIDAARLNVSDLAARIATIIEIHGERIIAGTITAREANFGSWFANNGFVNQLSAAVIHAIEVTAERGFIGGALLEDNTITVNKLTALDEIMSELGRFLVVEADQINVNSLVAQTGLVGLLEAVGMVLSNEAGGRRFEVSGNGFRLTDTVNDQVIAQLGTQSDDLISLHDSETGTPVITMTQDGGVSAQRLSSALDPYLAGKPLAGSLAGSPRWEIAESVLENLPLGIQAQHLRTFSTADNNSGVDGELAVTHLEAWITPGRVYRIACHNFEMGNREHYYMAAYYQTSSGAARPARPTMSSGVQLGQNPGARPAVTGGNTALSYEVFIAHPTARRIRILFAIGRYGDGAKTFGSQARHNARFVVEDVGPSVGRTGQSMLQWAGSTTGNLPEPAQTLSLTYPVAQTATYTLNPNTGVATRQYTGGIPRFGYWTTTNQYYLTVVTFAPWNQSGVPLRVTPRMRVGRWGSSRGHIVQNGIPSFTGTPTSFNFTTDVEPLEAQRNMGGGSIRPMSLSEEQSAAMAARAQASMVLGGTGWASASTGYLASGIFEPNGTAATLTTDPGGGAA